MRDFGPNARTEPSPDISPFFRHARNKSGHDGGGTRTVGPRSVSRGACRRHRHRVDKSLPDRHSRPSNAERECRSLPTRPACRHCRRQMPTVRARHKGVGIFDPRVGMSRRCSSRNLSVTRNAVGGPRRFFRHARTCSTAVRFNFGTGSVPTGGTVSAPCCHPGLDPGSRPVPDTDPGTTGTALAWLPWTPDQVRGDSGGDKDGGGRRAAIRVPIRRKSRKPTSTNALHPVHRS